MKRSTMALVGALAVGLIGGGTAYALTTTGQEPTAIETTAPTDAPTPEATPTSEPIVAETPQAPDLSTDAAFLTEVRARLARIQTQIPDVTDEQLVTLAHTACDLLYPDKTGENVSLIEGETKAPDGYYMDSGAIIIAARMTICPIEG